MDITKLLSSSQREIERHKENGIALLAFQNHVYGCFIVMEDIAQGVLELEDDRLKGNALYLNVDTQFSQIGIRYYGFVMDGKANYEDHSTEYKLAWLELFREIQKSKEMSYVDSLEDQMIEQLQQIAEKDRYFINALDHDGNLSPDWVEKALYLLHPTMPQEEREEREDQEKKSALSSAQSENRDRNHKRSSKHGATTKPSRRLSTTRRQRPSDSSRHRLSTTRRAHSK